MPESGRAPVWLHVVFGLQLLVTGLFLLLGWSMTVSLAQGRAAAIVDIVALAAPAMLVLACWVWSARAWRKQNQPTARLLAIVPLPAAMVLFMLMGAI